MNGGIDTKVSDLIAFCDKLNKDYDEVWLDGDSIMVKGDHYDGIDLAPVEYTEASVNDVIKEG